MGFVPGPGEIILLTRIIRRMVKVLRPSLAKTRASIIASIAIRDLYHGLVALIFLEIAAESFAGNLP